MEKNVVLWVGTDTNPIYLINRMPQYNFGVSVNVCIVVQKKLLYCKVKVTTTKYDAIYRPYKSSYMNKK